MGSSSAIAWEAPMDDAEARPDLTLVVPCYDAGPLADTCLEALRTWHEEEGRNVALEVLCVDDGCLDDTPARLERWAADWAIVHVLTHANNLGKGAALRTGMAAARGRLVLFLDCDLAVGPSAIRPALEALAAGARVVVGSRNRPAARVLRPQGWWRRTLGRLYQGLARHLLGLDVSDVTCGFKAFDRVAGQALFAASRCARWGIDAEILYLVRRRGWRTAEIPVTWRDGPRSAVRFDRDLLGSLVELGIVRWRGWFARTPSGAGSRPDLLPDGAPKPLGRG